jgi:hypothetical protein
MFDLESNGSGQVQTTKFCEQGDKPSNSIKLRNFLTVTVTASFSWEALYNGVGPLQKIMNQQQM